MTLIVVIGGEQLFILIVVQHIVVVVAVRAFVVPTDEERVIARDVAARLGRPAGTCA